MSATQALVLSLLACTLVACASAPSRSKSSAAGATLDHIVVGVADLATAIDEFERQTGVRPVIGGEHPGRGTHNALVSLGGPTYLEIFAAVPGADTPNYEALRYLTKPTPILWAVAVQDIPAAATELQAAGFATTTPEPGSRKTPSGSVLEWETFGLTSQPDGAPFFIRWKPGTPHPATTSPGGCKLERFTVRTPNPAPLQKLAKTLGLEVEATTGERTVLTMTLKCPKGTITLSP